MRSELLWGRRGSRLWNAVGAVPECCQFESVKHIYVHVSLPVVAVRLTITPGSHRYSVLCHNGGSRSEESNY
jgi:hypothetical protein